MKIAIIQFDNRPLDRLGQMPFLIHQNGLYAKRHGYDHVFLNSAIFDLPVYWQKPALCERALESGYDAVMWLDCDAVVHDMDRRLEDLFEGEEVMVGAPDIPIWPQPFNAGVFLARGAEGAKLMRRWLGLFEGTAWTRTETAWICEKEWAGPDFEQGAFNLHLFEELTRSGQMRVADWKSLQSPFPVEGSYTLHFAREFRQHVLPLYLTMI